MPARLAFFVCGAQSLRRLLKLVLLSALLVGVSEARADIASKAVEAELNALLSKFRLSNNIDFQDDSLHDEKVISAISASTQINRFSHYKGDYSLHDKRAFVEADLVQGQITIYVRDNIDLAKRSHTLVHELVHVVQYYLWFQALRRKPVSSIARTLTALNTHIRTGDLSQYYLSLGRLKSQPAFRHKAEDMLLAFVNVKVCMEYQAMRFSGELKGEGRLKQQTRQRASFVLNTGTLKNISIVHTLPMTLKEC